jgi:cytochrome c oxidase subunit 1
MARGRVAGNNPWNSNSLEWAAPSPPPHGNFTEVPVVYRGPYEYSSPASRDDFLPQWIPEARIAGPEAEPAASPEKAPVPGGDV